MQHLDSMTCGDVRWDFTSDIRTILFPAGELALDQWRRDQRVRIVKQAYHRTVYHVQLPGLRFYLKHYPKSDVRAWFRQLVRPSKARIEFDKAIEIAKRGVLTFEPLAVGERASSIGSGESYLVTRELVDAEPLNEFLTQTFPLFEKPRHNTIRKRLAIRLGKFLAQLHEAGIRHDDLHAGNLLLRLSSEDEPTIFLIDLHAVRLGERMDWEASCENLVLFNRWFTSFAARSDRGRFWHAYCRARAAFEREWGDSRVTDDRAHQLERATWDSNLDFWQRRDSRCLNANRYFQRIHGQHCRGFAVTDLDAALLKRLIDDPDQPFQDPKNHLLKDSRSSTVVEFQASIDGRLQPMILKRVSCKRLGDGLKSLVRRSGTWRSWIFGHGLRHRSLPTPRPLAILHCRRTGLPSHSYLLVEKIDGAKNLRDFTLELQKAPRIERQKIQDMLTAQLAGLLRRMHRCRLSHRDLKAVNILVQKSDGREQPTIWFIDLEGIRRSSAPLSTSRRIKDLTRLNASFLDQTLITRSDRLRFLKLYLECAWKGRGNWKEWWNAIDRATLRKVRRNEKYNRPLA